MVFDLDGVVRDFAQGSPVAEIEAELGLVEGGFFEVAFGADYLGEVVTGRMTFQRWMASIGELLVERGAEPAAARAAVQRWVAHRGTPVTETVSLIAELQVTGRDCFLFTNGTDNVPAELRQLGLQHLLDGLLNTSDLGVAKPEPAAFAAANDRIERQLGRRVEPEEVGFTDDRADNVAAAAAYGWQAVLFDPTR